ncbi:hypothetical protein EYF80_045871 [Liparis tanakae]|uniref:Uncharacterized protein n=1 Tax=Liparis tanakae TaxID=230148 RepID=A0A4Z2FT92_9TELE|nr:hypothetical protein EYF80_045871 [Liparis tanakae]
MTELDPKKCLKAFGLSESVLVAQCGTSVSVHSFIFPPTNSQDVEEEERQKVFAPLARVTREGVLFEDVVPLAVGVEHLHVLEGVVGSHGEVDVSGGEEVEYARLEVQVLHREPLFALGLGRLVGKSVRCRRRHRRAAPGPAGALGLRRSSLEVSEVDALVGRTAVKTQVQVLVVTFLHRVHHFLRHAHGEGQVAADLPDHDGRSDVAGLDLHVLPGNLFHDAQGVRSVPVASVLGAVCKRGWQLIRLRVVHLLVHAFLEVLEDDHPELLTISPTHTGRREGILTLVVAVAKDPGTTGVLVFVVNERPGSFHLTRLEVVTKCSEVRIPEEATVGVVGRRRVAKKTPLVVADLGAVGALLAVGQERRRRRRKRCAGTWL